MDADLASRLIEAGVDPSKIGDPEQSWMRLHDHFGSRATLIDRYALDAEYRGVAVEELPEADRRLLGRRIIEIRYPGIGLVGPVGGDPVFVVPYDPRWPELYTATRDDLRNAMGDVAVRVDHVGSTAVPGLTAKPVIDIQISVPDVEDEGTYLPAVVSTGVPLRAREPGHRYFRPLSGRPRTVQIHVCDSGGRWERTHLLFRDYLLAHSEARDAYGTLKEELADRYRNDRIAYNEAKTGFIFDTLDLASDWATQTGWTP